MNSFPLIETSLSDTDRQFACFVERHVTGRDTLYEADGDSSMLGDTVKMTVTSGVTADDRSESRRAVEFMSLGADGHWQSVGYIVHSTKRAETTQIESTFELRGPGIPHGRYTHAEVEPVVQSHLDKLSAARLLPLRAQNRLRRVEPQVCAT